MNDRQKRLIEVYEHLRRYFGIHTKTGFAEALHYGRTSLSAAMNGDNSYLTDKLFKNICEAYPGVFDLHYLLTGEGDLLTVEEDVKSTEFEKQMTQQNNIPPATDQTYLMSKMFETILKPIESAHAQQVASLEHHIATLEKDKEELLRDKESMNRHIRELESRLSQYESGYRFDNFPFPQGVAENDDIKSTRV